MPQAKLIPIPVEEINTSTDAEAGAEAGAEDLERVAETLLKLSNWSQKIRYLSSEGFSTSSISKILTALRGRLLRPQHVNNVLQAPLKGQTHRGRPPERDPRADSLLVELARKRA